MANKLISKITLNGVVYDLKDANARARLTSLEGVVRGGIQIKVENSLPPASADTLGVIHFIPLPHANGQNRYEEYLTVVGGTEQTPTYSWEKIGTTDIDLSNYTKKTHKHSLTTNVGVNTKKYTPKGTISKPSVSCSFLSENKSTSKLADAGTLPSLTAGSVTKGADTKANFATQGMVPTYRESEEALLFVDAPATQAVTGSGNVTYTSPQLTPGTLPTFTEVTIPKVTSIVATLESAPVFTGTEEDITPTLVNNTINTGAAID